tara:strand:- start:351 stop:758 length:408 start_codon:yes stop_codon:yes gene_type:complete
MPDRDTARADAAKFAFSTGIPTLAYFDLERVEYPIGERYFAQPVEEFRKSDTRFGRPVVETFTPTLPRQPSPVYKISLDLGESWRLASRAEVVNRFEQTFPDPALALDCLEARGIMDAGAVTYRTVSTLDLEDFE